MIYNIPYNNSSRKKKGLRNNIKRLSSIKHQKPPTLFWVFYCCRHPEETVKGHWTWHFIPPSKKRWKMRVFTNCKTKQIRALTKPIITHIYTPGVVATTAAVVADIPSPPQHVRICVSSPIHQFSCGSIKRGRLFQFVGETRNKSILRCST